MSILICTSKYLVLFLECRRVSIQAIFISIVLSDEKIFLE